MFAGYVLTRTHEDTLFGQAGALLINIRVSCKCPIGANTLAYFTWTFATKKKKFYDIGAGAIGSLVFEEEYKNEVFKFFFN
jgi:hypothetical protein